MLKSVLRYFSAFILCLNLSPLQANPDIEITSERIDPYLQQQLERRVAELGLTQAVKHKQLNIALIDITDIKHPRIAALNGDHMVYAASLPKIAILFGAFERIQNGEMALNEENRRLLTQMIPNSSNSAATEMLHRVGKEYLAELLQSSKYQLYCKAMNGGLWVGKEYGRGVAWKRDPLHHLSHGATAIQAARLYYLMENGQLLKPELAKEMKAILGQPGIAHKFVKGLKKAAPEAVIYRKSGTWKQFHADSAIVEHEGHRYIAVALAESPQGSHWLSELIVAMDEIVLQPQPVAYLRQ